MNSILNEGSVVAFAWPGTLKSSKCDKSWLRDYNSASNVSVCIEIIRWWVSELNRVT